MDNHTIAKSRAGIDRYIGINLAVTADMNARTNDRARANPGVIADLDLLADHDPLRHGHVFTQPG